MDILMNNAEVEMNVYDFWKAVLAQDEQEIRKYFHNDAYVNWHCTNEHFTVDEFIIAMELEKELTVKQLISSPQMKSEAMIK